MQVFYLQNKERLEKFLYAVKEIFKNCLAAANQLLYFPNKTFLYRRIKINFDLIYAKVVGHQTSP